jgi:transcriptional regulator with XRE-family HTH domain
MHQPARVVRPEDLQARLGRVVRSLRIARRKTQEELASQAGMGPRHLQKIEAGEVNVTLRTLCRLAATLRTDPGQLLTKSEPG